MKKLLVAAIVAVSLVGMQAMASVSLSLGAADILDNNGNLAPVNTVGLWIVDTSGGTSLSPILTLGENIAVGATLTGTTDKIVDAEDINSTTASPGSISLSYAGTYGSGVNGTSVAVGQKFGLIWLVNQAIGQTTAVAGWYGEFNDAAGAYSNPWVLPADGGNVSYDMTTASEGGSVPNSMGMASLQIVPEPSSIMLVLVGLLGGFGLIRRRS